MKIQWGLNMELILIVCMDQMMNGIASRAVQITSGLNLLTDRLKCEIRGSCSIVE